MRDTKNLRALLNKSRALGRSDRQATQYLLLSPREREKKVIGEIKKSFNCTVNPVTIHQAWFLSLRLLEKWWGEGIYTEATESGRKPPTPGSHRPPSHPPTFSRGPVNSCLPSKETPFFQDKAPHLLLQCRSLDFPRPIKPQPSPLPCRCNKHHSALQLQTPTRAQDCFKLFSTYKFLLNYKSGDTALILSGL